MFCTICINNIFYPYTWLWSLYGWGTAPSIVFCSGIGIEFPKHYILSVIYCDNTVRKVDLTFPTEISVPDFTNAFISLPLYLAITLKNSSDITGKQGIVQRKGFLLTSVTFNSTASPAEVTGNFASGTWI